MRSLAALKTVVLLYKPGDFPVAERIARTSLSLPLYPELPIEDVQRVVEICRDVLSRFESRATR